VKRSLIILTIGLAGCSAAGGSGGTSSSVIPNPGNTTTTFQDPVNLQIAANTAAGTPRRLVIEDFNSDSYYDIALFTDSGVYVYLNNAGSAWSSPVLIAATSGQSYRVGAYANGDLISYRDGSYLSLLSNDGSGIFSETTLPSNATTNPAWLAYAPASSTAATGFIFAAVGTTGSSFITARSGTTLGPTQTTVTSSILTSAALKVLAGDIDGDSFVDFALIPTTGSAAIEFYKNTSDTSIASSPTASLTRSGNASIRDAVLVDMDGDSKLDLFLATSNGFELYSGAGKFTDFTFQSTFSPQSLTLQPISIAVADFTGDGRNDFFISQSGSTSALYTQTGTISFSDISSTAFGSLLTRNTMAVYAADIDRNGYSDIIELKSDKSIVVHTNNLKKQ
jgi:hypothetical protein